MLIGFTSFESYDCSHHSRLEKVGKSSGIKPSMTQPKSTMLYTILVELEGKMIDMPSLKSFAKIK